MPIRLICLDADDTLWGHESYFQEAARRYEQLLASQVDGEQAMRRLDEIEDRNLHLYGYGVKGFTLSMMETAVEMLGDRLSSDAHATDPGHRPRSDAPPDRIAAGRRRSAWARSPSARRLRSSPRAICSIRK